MDDKMVIEKINELTQKKRACIKALDLVGQINANEEIRNLLQTSEQTPGICLAAVKADGWAIMYVKNQTPEICLAAVKENGMALEYIDNKTLEICLCAVQQTGHAIKYVPEPTEELWLEAIKSRPEAIRYNENPTKDLCMEAIKRNWSVLYELPIQYPEMCVYASNIDEEAIDCIRKWTPEIERAFVEDGWEIVSPPKNKKLILDDRITKINKNINNTRINEDSFKKTSKEHYK